MSRSVDMQCWKCGSELKNLLLPFSRYEECTVCKADLHACLACKHYDPRINDACREDRAEFVLDKDKANFCDYFKLNSRPFKPKDDSAAQEARRKLAALFGEDVADEDTGASVNPQTEAEKALAELKRLFGDDDKPA